MVSLMIGEVEVLLDREDFDRVSKIKWHINTKTGYVQNRHLNLYLHRFIVGAKEDEVVDHINGIKTDNRKENLRICSQKQNLANVSVRINQENKTSKYKGVGWHKAKRKWRVRVKDIHVGYFDDEQEAAKAYNERALIEFGEFTRLNVID